MQMTEFDPHIFCVHLVPAAKVPAFNMSTFDSRLLTIVQLHIVYLLNAAASLLGAYDVTYAARILRV